MESSPREWIAVLRHSHERLLDLAGPLSPEQISGQSYCRDWTIAQLLSHVGSGAEIGMMMLPVALGQADTDSVGADAFQPVWDRWNAMTPDNQAAAGLVADAQYVSMLDQLTDDELASISFPFFGLTLDAVGLIRMRLGDHALHTWDVAVVLDPAAVVAPDAVELLVDMVSGFLAPRMGKAPAEPFRARIRTTEPARDYLLATSDAVSLADWPGEEAIDQEGPRVADVTMPAEAWLRLAAGRLDADHTPASVVAKPADLDVLRAIFPGF